MKDIKVKYMNNTPSYFNKKNFVYVNRYQITEVFNGCWILSCKMLVGFNTFLYFVYYLVELQSASCCMYIFLSFWNLVLLFVKTSVNVFCCLKIF